MHGFGSQSLPLSCFRNPNFLSKYSYTRCGWKHQSSLLQQSWQSKARQGCELKIGVAKSNIDQEFRILPDNSNSFSTKTSPLRGSIFLPHKKRFQVCDVEKFATHNLKVPFLHSPFPCERAPVKSGHSGVGHHKSGHSGVGSGWYGFFPIHYIKSCIVLKFVYSFCY